MSVMLYKAGGEHDIHGGKFDYIIVDEKDVKDVQQRGWFLTTTEAAENKPVTREELEQKANELGVDFHHKISDNNLIKKIKEHLASKEK